MLFCKGKFIVMTHCDKANETKKKIIWKIFFSKYEQGHLKVYDVDKKSWILYLHFFNTESCDQNVNWIVKNVVSCMKTSLLVTFHKEVVSLIFQFVIFYVSYIIIMVMSSYILCVFSIIESFWGLVFCHTNVWEGLFYYSNLETCDRTWLISDIIQTY